MLVFIIVLFTTPLCLGQNWFTQEHYETSACNTAPYLEASADGGAGACPASPCSLFLGQPRDYLVTRCPGGGPSISITGGLRSEQYTDANCNTLVSVTAYVTDTCISLPSSSLRVVCTDSGAVQLSYSDRFCSSPTTNTTLATGAPNTCQQAVRYSCGASALSYSALGLLLAVLCYFL